jgi:segregation and condensation protein B
VKNAPSLLLNIDPRLSPFEKGKNPSPPRNQCGATPYLFQREEFEHSLTHSFLLKFSKITDYHIHTMTTTIDNLQQIIEAAIMVAGRPLTVADLQKLFDEHAAPDANIIRGVLTALTERHAAADSGIELCEVASGFQLQAKPELSPWLARLWEERAPRFSRALLETLALIAYRQPITRAEIEEIRGVAVSSNIIKTLQERDWIRIVGHRDIPGKPGLYATTKTFLDHLNLKSLSDLPSLAELKDLDSQVEKLQVQLELSQPEPSTEMDSPELSELDNHE